jgi:hypothetical protein
MNKPNATTKKTIGGRVILVLLNWISKSCGNLKFKYDLIHTNWVEVDSIIFIITMNYEKEKDVYRLDCIDATFLNDL